MSTEGRKILIAVTRALKLLVTLFGRSSRGRRYEIKSG